MFFDGNLFCTKLSSRILKRVSSNVVVTKSDARILKPVSSNAIVGGFGSES